MTPGKTIRIAVIIPKLFLHYLIQVFFSSEALRCETQASKIAHLLSVFSHKSRYGNTMKPLAVYPAAYVGVAFKHTVDHLCLKTFFHIYLPL